MWTPLESDGQGNRRYQIDGSIDIGDIDPGQINHLCAGGHTCALVLAGTKCNGIKSNSAPGPIYGEPRVDTPVTYLDKVGWVVRGIAASMCEDGNSQIQLYLNAYSATGSALVARNVVLASNDGSGGSTLPPITPTPDPLSCSLSLNNGGVLDWGTVPLADLTVNKYVGAGSEARVTCSGDGTATAKLTFTGMNGSGNIAEMKNASGDIIPAKVILNNELNTISFNVSGGYNVSRDLYARIQAYNISTYGEYKGSALLTLELL